LTDHPFTPPAGVEAAHQRIHRTLGSECAQLMLDGDRNYNMGCVELDCAYAALDVQPHDMIARPWEVDPYHATPEEIATAAGQLKAEILADIEGGVIPDTVSDFSVLHDYVDANTYAGFCGASDGGGVDRSSWDSGSLSATQDVVQAWLEEGRHATMIAKED
jgi:hypothetical protein